MRKIKLIADYDEFKAGTIVEVDNETAKELIESKTGKAYVEEKKETETPQMPNVDEVVKKAIADEMAKLAKPETKEHSPVTGTDPIDEDPKGGFKSYDHFARQVFNVEKNHSLEPELRKWVTKTTGYQEEAQDSMGGFATPPEYSKNLLEKVWTSGEIMSRCTKMAIGGKSIEIPAVAETSRADGSRQGGIRGYWTDELAQMSLSNATFEMVELKPEKLTVFTYASSEVLEDSVFNLGNWLLQGQSKETVFKIEDAIYAGTGVKQPLGVLNAAATVSVTRSSAGVIVWRDVYGMYSRLHPESVKNAVWLVSPAIFGQLTTMCDAASRVIWLPSGNIAGSPFGTLYGIPVVPTEHVKNLNTAGDLALCDFSQYLLATRGTARQETSIHLKFDYDITAFRTIIRVDGQPWWSSAVTPYNSGSTLSPFVVLGSA